MNKEIIGGNPKITNTGTTFRPYYMIEYFDSKDSKTHLGFGSKKLSVVQQYLQDYFERG